LIKGIFPLHLDGYYYRIFRGIFREITWFTGEKHFLIKISMSIRESKAPNKKNTTEGIMPKNR